MKTAIDIRKQLGLSQQQLANYLRISRSTLNMYERGERSLPTPALLKLGRLEIAYLDVKASRSQAGEENMTSQNTTGIINELQKQARECRRRAAVLEKQLQEARQYYSELNDRVSLSEMIAAGLPADESSKGDSLWIEIVRDDATREVVEYRAKEQFWLQHRINILLMQATAHEAALDQLRNGTFKNES